jgi:RNA polymerase sigma factor (sigma-70 family)
MQTCSCAPVYPTPPSLAKPLQTMTELVAPSASTRSAAAQSDSYDDIVEMFLALSQMPAESDEYARQRERIVARCLPLADHVARHFGRRGENREDLTQVARLGLMNAVNRFDPAKGPSFIGYAIPTMMGEVRRYFRDFSWGMRVPRRLRDLYVQISRATADLAQKLGRAPTASELSQVLGVSTRRSSNASSQAMLTGSSRWTHLSEQTIRAIAAGWSPMQLVISTHRSTTSPIGKRYAPWWPRCPKANVRFFTCGSSNR